MSIRLSMIAGGTIIGSGDLGIVGFNDVMGL
jgi:hypothetical protein